MGPATRRLPLLNLTQKRPAKRITNSLTDPNVTIHAEQRVIAYTPAQLFRLVADVEKYPEFLPWCLAARVRRRQPSCSSRPRLTR